MAHKCNPTRGSGSSCMQAQTLTLSRVGRLYLTPSVELRTCSRSPQADRQRCATRARGLFMWRAPDQPTACLVPDKWIKLGFFTIFILTNIRSVENSITPQSFRRQLASECETALGELNPKLILVGWTRTDRFSPLKHQLRRLF